MSTLHLDAAPYFEPGNEALRFLPECPRVLQNYPGGSTKLGWVAIQNSAEVREGSINVLDLASGRHQSFPLPGRPGFFAETTRPGCVLIGLERRLVYFHLLTGLLTETGIQVTADERVIIQRWSGGGWRRTIRDQGSQIRSAHRGALFLRFHDAKGSHRIWGTDLLQWQIPAPRCRRRHTLIDIDTTPKTITRYRLDAKLDRVIGHSLITPPDVLPGLPDGMRPSPDGESVSVAFYNPEAVADGVAQQLRISDGAVLCEWRIPGSPRVTCPEFVEVNGKVKLVFTTAVENMPAATRRLASGSGALYLADTPFDKMHCATAASPVSISHLKSCATGLPACRRRPQGGALRPHFARVSCGK